MSRSGPVGGAATLSSLRVQKAFSINFRENKRLLSEIKLIENEHIRNIRHVKQEIKETRIWLEGVRESTGKSEYGMRPDTEPGQTRKKKAAAQRSKSVVPEVIHQAPPMSEFSADEDDDLTKYSEQEPVTHVHFDKGRAPDMPSRTLRPWTEETAVNDKTRDRQRSDLKSEPALPLRDSKNDVTLNEDETHEPGSKKDRVYSAASVRSSLVSLTVRQRRHKLQKMVAKKQNPLEYKRSLIAKETKRIDRKVAKYLDTLPERMNIPMPDLKEWGVRLDHHDTPFAQDVNVTT